MGNDDMQKQMYDLSEKLNEIHNVVVRVDTTLNLQKDHSERISTLENQSSFAKGAMRMMMFLTGTSVGATVIQYFQHYSK